MYEFPLLRLDVSPVESWDREYPEENPFHRCLVPVSTSSELVWARLMVPPSSRMRYRALPVMRTGEGGVNA